MRTFNRFTPLLLLTLLAGCQNAAQFGPANAPAGTVTHVVVMWLYDPADDTARHDVLNAARTIEQMPGVLHVSAGRVLPSDRPVVDSTFDVGFVVTFKNAEAMHQYLKSPQHDDLKKNVLDRYVKKYLIYDFAAE